ncbi:hypothetical protein NIES4101_53400 [Calothrix sp. NIES-4101]|nr:hypothetical protein NIES4101_53400 [Calothrix sp. NIES-4101]
MYYWINENGNIAGYSDAFMPDDSRPQGFDLVEGPDLPIADLYFDGENVVEKPEKPGDRFFWNEKTKQWEEIPSAELFQGSNWDRLLLSLQSSPEWAKAYAASERTLKANSAYTTLLVTLTNIRDISTLEWAIAKLREAMTAISGIGDFTAEEIEEINLKLADAGFSLALE